MIKSWLPVLADPTGIRHPLPAAVFDATALPVLIETAGRHGVLPAVIRNLKMLQREDSGIICGDDLAKVLERGEGLLLQYVANSMHLRRQSDEIIAAMRNEGLPGMVFKGPQFADRLYPAAAMRTFTDIDLLVSESTLPQAEAILVQLGYRQQAVPMKYADGYGETAWTRSTRSAGTVELHWNLVNSPTIRRRVDVRYEDLEISEGEASADSLLLIAVVHAAASHSFDRLGPLIDILQAVRGAAGELDEIWLKQSLAKTGASFCMATALSLTGTLLREPLCGELLERLGLTGFGLWPVVLPPSLVVSRKSRLAAIRRKLYREGLKRV